MDFAEIWPVVTGLTGYTAAIFAGFNWMLKAKIEPLKDNQIRMESEIKEITSEIKEIKLEQGEVKSEIKEIKLEQGEVKSEIKEIKLEQKEIKAMLTQLLSNQQGAVVSK